MSIVPRDVVAKIGWYEDHIAPFTANSAAIGIASAEAADLQTKTEAARAAFEARRAAAQAAEAATLSMYDAVAAMGTAGAALIDKIRAKAKQVGGNSVYTLAQIPAPATPAAVGAPGLPYQLKVVLKPNGSLDMTWKCNNPTGCNNVIYQVYRKAVGDAQYEYLGGTGSRKFVDATVPSGAASLMYQIQGTRSTAVGDEAEFVVNFGVGAGGATVTPVTPDAPKLAA